MNRKRMMMKKKISALLKGSPSEAFSLRARHRVKSLSLMKMRRRKKVTMILKKKRWIRRRKLKKKYSSSMKRGLRMQTRGHL
jgi:hypothetical protein